MITTLIVSVVLWIFFSIVLKNMVKAKVHVGCQLVAAMVVIPAFFTMFGSGLYLLISWVNS